VINKSREEGKQFQLQILKEMIQFILMLFGLAFGNNNANTSACHQNPVTVQSGTSNPGLGVDPGGSEGDTGGDTGPVRPPKN